MEINTVRMGLRVFQELKMLEILYGNTYYLTNFEKHQELTKIELNNDRNRLRVQKCRERKKLELSSSKNVMITTPLRNTDVIAQVMPMKSLQKNVSTSKNVMITVPLHNSDVTPTDKDTDKDIDTDKHSNMYKCIHKEKLKSKNVCLSELKKTKEYTSLQLELMEKGWTGNLDVLLKEIGWEACQDYWNNQLKKELKKASTKLGGGWITNKFRNNAKIFHQYNRKKKLSEKSMQSLISEDLKKCKEYYKNFNSSFVNDFQDFIEHNNHTDEEKKQLRSKKIKSIDDLSPQPKGILEYFLNWRGIAVNDNYKSS
jgi:hypothetical protein